MVMQMQQMKSHLEMYKDVLLVWQAGFIGAWGEWHHSIHGYGFENDSTRVRKIVIDSMRANAPANCFVSLNGPSFKFEAMGDSTALTAAQAYGTTLRSTVCTNDNAATNNWSDSGTLSINKTESVYTDTAVTRVLLHGDDRYQPFVAEPNGSTAGYTTKARVLYDASYLRWTSAMGAKGSASTIAWRDSLNTWAIRDTLNKRMGYRFYLVSATLPTVVSNSLRFQCVMGNAGYTATPWPRKFKLVLRNNDNGAVTQYDLSAGTNCDPRRWLPDATTSIDTTIGIGVADGNYSVLLNLPDPETVISTRPEYSIQLANTGVWEASTGFNDLGLDVTVQNTKCVLLDRNK